MNAKVLAWKNHIPVKYQGTYAKAMTGKSRAAGVKAKCQDCMNWNAAEVRRCDITTCPLYPYRPGARRNTPERG